MLVLKNLVLFFLIYYPLNIMAEGMPKKASPFDLLTISSPNSLSSLSGLEDISILKPSLLLTDECRKDLMGRPLSSQNVMEIGKVIDFSSCNVADKLTDENRFTPTMCAAQISCVNAMYRSGVPLSLENIQDTEHIAEEIMAYDMKDKISEMDEVNKLRKFAEKKYPAMDVSEICNREPIFEAPPRNSENEANTCKMSVVNNAVRMSQTKCVIGSLNCFPDLENFKIEADNDSNLLEKYFKEKTDSYVSTALKSDDLILDALASLFANSKMSDDEKVKATYDYLQKNSLIIDPVFSELMKGFSTLKTSQSFNQAIRSIITDSKMDTATKIKQKIENVRLEETKKLLIRKCQEVHTVAQFCNTGKDLTGGAEVQASREQIVETTKIRKNANWLLLPKDKKLVQDANRCTTFGLGAPFVLSFGRSTGRLPSISILNTGVDKLGELSDIVGSTVSGKKKVQYVMNSKGNITNTSKPDISNLRRVNKSADSSSENKNISYKAPNAQGAATPLPITAVPPNSVERATTLPGKTVPGIIQPTINANSFSIMNGNDLGVSGNLPKIQNSNNTLNSSSFIPSESNKELNDQIKALTKKLNSNENRIAKISAEKLEKNENDIKEKNAEKDSAQNEKSEKISDMKKELAELTQKQQAQHSAKLKDSAPSEESSSALASSEATTSGASLSSNTPSAAPEKSNFAEAVASSSGSSSSSESSSGSSSFRPPSATAATSGAAHAQAGATLVLGKTDGAEVIANKIMELKNGESFFIEEDGKFKEIFPIMNGKDFVLDANGKPRFEKIEICDGEDKKCIEAKLQAKVKIKNTKQPEAKISSVADLVKNQDEKLKYERVEYLKLKALTKRTIEKAKK